LTLAAVAGRPRIRIVHPGEVRNWLIKLGFTVALASGDTVERRAVEHAGDATASSLFRTPSEATASQSASGSGRQSFSAMASQQVQVTLSEPVPRGGTHD
jgi:hypothetical protein